MMYFVRKTLMAFLVSASGLAYAGSAIDGVHQCTANGAGRTATLYLVVLTNASGVTAWAPVNITASTSNWGYGMGTISGSSWTGKDESGNAFVLTLNSGNSFAGSTTNQSNGVSFAVTISCTKIW